MVLLKVLLVTFVSCQVVNYGRAMSLSHFRPYGRMNYDELTNWHYRRLPPFNLRSFSTTQRPVQLATVNKEYGHKLGKSEIMPNKFFVSDVEASWDESYTICESRGMILASPQNMLQLHKLQAFLEVLDAIPTDESGYWLGGRRKNNFDDRVFYWQFNGEKIDDQLWLPSQPNSYEGENCVEFKKASYVGMELNNFYCGLHRRFICEVVNHEEYRKNDRTYPVASDSREESHFEINKVGNEGPAGASGKENLSTMTTTTNAGTSIASHETNTTTSATTTSTEKYYSGSRHLSIIEDPFSEYEDYY